MCYIWLQAINTEKNPLPKVLLEEQITPACILVDSLYPPKGTESILSKLFLAYDMDLLRCCTMAYRRGTGAVQLTESRQDQEEGGSADPQVSPEEFMSREVELGCESWTSSLLQVVTQQRCNG